MSPSTRKTSCTLLCMTAWLLCSSLLKASSRLGGRNLFGILSAWRLLTMSFSLAHETSAAPITSTCILCGDVLRSWDPPFTTPFQFAVCTHTERVFHVCSDSGACHIFDFNGKMFAHVAFNVLGRSAIAAHPSFGLCFASDHRKLNFKDSDSDDDDCVRDFSELSWPAGSRPLFDLSDTMDPPAHAVPSALVAYKDMLVGLCPTGSIHSRGNRCASVGCAWPAAPDLLVAVSTWRR